MKILLIIITCLALLGFLRVGICIDEKLKIQIVIGFFKLTIKKSKKKEIKKTKETKKTKPKQNIDYKKYIKQYWSSENFSLILSFLQKLLKKSVKSIKIKKFELLLSLAGKTSPSKTAKLYWKICAVSGSLLSFANEHLQMKKFYVNIFPNFKEEKTDFKLKFMATISIGRGFLLGFYALFLGLSIFLKIRKGTEQNGNQKPVSRFDGNNNDKIA